MAQQLRQRSTASTAPIVNNSSEKDDDNEVILGAGLSAASMLEASPSQHGVVLKLHIPLLFSILPTSLQSLVVSWNCLSWFQPQWRQRYLIQMGSFLYKFKNKSSVTPKGTPLSLELIESNLLSSIAAQDDEMAPAFSKLPPGYDSIFTVSTALGKKNYYAVSGREEALAWVNSLRQSRQDAITRSMGHATNIPYPKSWSYFDSLGRSLQKSKLRIKEKIEQHNMREMELAAITGVGGGGPGPRGFYYG